VVLASSTATSFTIGLIAIFGGIALVVNPLIVYIAAVVGGERRENQEYQARLGRSDEPA
jgi:ABC-type lipoprotein release transport system permease subunit